MAVLLLVPLVLEITEANKYVSDVNLSEAGALEDPFVYAASNQMDWSSRISQSTTPGPTADKPPRKKPSQNYQPSSSPSYPVTRQAHRKKKPTTTNAPGPKRNVPQGASYNTETYPGNQYSATPARHNPPQSTYPERSTRGNVASNTPSAFDSTPFAPPARTLPISSALMNRRKPVFSQSNSPIASYRPPAQNEQTTPDYTVVRHMPLGGGANGQQYSTVFPTPQPQAQRKRVVIVRKTKPSQQETVYGSTTAYNYPQQTRPEASAGPRNVHHNPFTTIPTYPLIPGYDDEGFRFTDIRNRITEPSDEEPSDSRHNSERFFEPPKFEIPKGLDQKGCKMVIKEVQEVPKDLHARGSDLMESFFRSKRSPSDSRKAKTIIMTKECYYPDGTPSGSAQSHQFEESFPSYGPSSNPPRRSSKAYQASKNRPKYDRTSTESYDSSSGQYDYPKRRRQGSDYDNSGSYQASQSSNRNRQKNTQAPKRQPKEEYNSRGPATEGKYNQDRDYSTDSSYEGRDYHQSDPSQANYERSGFDDDYPGFSFETGFGGPEHEPRASKPRASSGGGGRSRGRVGHGGHRGHDGHSGNDGHSGHAEHIGHDGHSGHDVHSGHDGHSGHGGQGSASGKVSHGHHNRPTPKMYQKTFTYYKKDDGKENDPNNNSNAEEYASGYFKHFSTDYDSDRDGPKKKN